jgi:hypothetical protein
MPTSRISESPQGNRLLTRISTRRLERVAQSAPCAGSWTAPTTPIGHATARLLGCRKPQRIGGQGTRAWLYSLPAGRFESWRAVAVGHVIIVEPMLLARHGRWLLAHELAHTRQHDWLGPAYLPVHAVLLFLSMVVFFFRPIAGFSRWHAYNPLERALICVSIDAIAVPPEGALADNVLHAFGLEPTRPEAAAT